jgi:hypothetical protein
MVRLPPRVFAASAYAQPPLYQQCSYCGLLDTSNSLSACEACLCKRYCSVKCQELHWEAGHKLNREVPHNRQRRMPSTFLNTQLETALLYDDSFRTVWPGFQEPPVWNGIAGAAFDFPAHAAFVLAMNQLAVGGPVMLPWDCSWLLPITGPPPGLEPIPEEAHDQDKAPVGERIPRSKDTHGLQNNSIKKNAARTQTPGLYLCPDGHHVVPPAGVLFSATRPDGVHAQASKFVNEQSRGQTRQTPSYPAVWHRI